MKCPRCNGQVRRALTPDGEYLLLDKHPTPAGTWRIRGTGRWTSTAEQVGYTIDLFDSTDDGIRHTRHLCTQA